MLFPSPLGIVKVVPLGIVVIPFAASNIPCPLRTVASVAAAPVRLPAAAESPPAIAAPFRTSPPTESAVPPALHPLPPMQVPVAVPIVSGEAAILTVLASTPAPNVLSAATAGLEFAALLKTLLEK